jgi:phospholipase C
LVHLRNAADKPLSVEMRDNAYKTKLVTRRIEPRQEISVILRLEQSHGWYDFTVKANGSDAESRFAGRVETGRASFSDPLMGGTV